MDSKNHDKQGSRNKGAFEAWAAHKISRKEKNAWLTVGAAIVLMLLWWWARSSQ